jgi:hypothetical protein
MIQKNRSRELLFVVMFTLCREVKICITKLCVRGVINDEDLFV